MQVKLKDVHRCFVTPMQFFYFVNSVVINCVIIDLCVFQHRLSALNQILELLSTAEKVSSKDKDNLMLLSCVSDCHIYIS